MLLLNSVTITENEEDKENTSGNLECYQFKSEVSRKCYRAEILAKTHVSRHLSWLLQETSPLLLLMTL